MQHLSVTRTKGGKNASLAAFLMLVVTLFSLERQQAVDSFQFSKSSNLHEMKSRRNIITSVAQFTSIILIDPMVSQKNANALSLPFVDQQQDRRQKELCLVNLLRLQFWAEKVSDKLKEIDIDDDESRKKLYVEARLGSKVMVAESKKISGGATANVFMLKGLHLRECLDDLTYYADKSSKRQMAQYKDDLIESIASIVEFDGLETTQDDSPRSSLTLSMYNSKKSIFVQRMLGERIVPLTNDIFRLFGPEARAQTEYYMREFYPSEMKT
eukprot:CAMPEP_0116123842 /NCGR_PEP_ID=MMETSP0329-20121206/4965_1 /TAXON_ID=697910 /ORGANISM="Pseudo-nitzschia arenysensis, Strain B593" /LENGTH=269 /DNA_ID=CAMNT_0003617787 /DNA_START=66 /DNA_END=872 /DNA_ORIENTATION=-